MNTWNFLAWESELKKVQDVIVGAKTKLLPICTNESLVILRDWQGKITLCIPCSRYSMQNSGLGDWAHGLSESLGLLASTVDITYCKDEFFDPEDVWNSPNLVNLYDSEGLKISLLDRQDKEGDWLRKAPMNRVGELIPRAIFYGVKGGVGRSSAIAALAIRLADMGKKVLIVDMDFESPGVSSSLLGTVQPEFGLVDWMTAHALGCPQEQLRDMVATKITEVSPLSKLTKGRIIVAPSHAKLTEAYIDKLGRIYRTTSEGVTFAERLETVVTALEVEHEIDVTLIDSRAGIDDTAAAAITQLYARVAFLFAINTEQTWDAYAILFKHLAKHPSLHTEQDFRTSLRMVSALTPAEVGADKGYWERFLERAYETCSNLYDEDDGSGNKLVFSPAPDNDESPHFALKVMWNEVLRAFAPLNEPGQLEPTLIDGVFGNFLTKATLLLEKT